MCLDILLVSLGNEDGDRRKSIPLALPVLKGVLKESGFSVRCIVLENTKISPSDFYDLLDNLKPKIVGLSATAYQTDRLKELTRKIKSYSIEIAVIIGGYCSLVDDLIEKTKADAICHGEGEVTIIELVKHFLKPINQWDEGIKKIKGISFINRNTNKTIKTPKRELISDLDVIPFPDYSDFDFEEYGNNQWIPFYAQRGCYNHCTFCDIIPFYGEQRIRSISPDRIVDWMCLEYERRNIPYFLFTDDNFMSSRDFLTRFIESIEQSGLIGKAWINFQTRTADILRFKDLLEKMKSFIFSIELGIESFSESQLKRFNKNITRKQNMDALKLLNSLKIPYNNYYMFLDEKTTIGELEENVNTILSLEDVYCFNFLNPLPEIILNYQYSALCDIDGVSSIEKVGYLKAFHFFLEETESIRKAFIFYRALKKVDLTENEEIQLGDFQKEFFSSLIKSLGPNIVKIGQERLKTALVIAKYYHNKEKDFRENKHRFIDKKIKLLNGQVSQILSPLQKLGVDFDNFVENY